MTQKLSQPQFVVLYKLLLGITNYFKLLNSKRRRRPCEYLDIGLISPHAPKGTEGVSSFISVFIIIIRPKLRSTLSLEIIKLFFLKFHFLWLSLRCLNCRHCPLTWLCVDRVFPLALGIQHVVYSPAKYLSITNNAHEL